MNWTHFMIHHSLTEDGNTVSWDAIRRYHISTMKMKDIGYHFGVERAGIPYEAILGRPLDMEGAHCKEKGMNKLAIGICLVGNYDLYPPHPEALMVIVKRILIPLSRIYAIPLDANHILFHREYATYKTCPGSQFTKDMVFNLLPSSIA